MDYNLRIIGRRMREARELRHRSLAWLSDKTGVTEGYLSRIERGQIPTPGLQTMGAVARALGMTLAELVGEKEASADEITELFRKIFGAADEAIVQEMRTEIDDLDPEDAAIIADIITAVTQRRREARERRRRELQGLVNHGTEPEEPPDGDDPPEQDESPTGEPARMLVP